MRRLRYLPEACLAGFIAGQVSAHLIHTIHQRRCARAAEES